MINLGRFGGAQSRQKQDVSAGGGTQPLSVLRSRLFQNIGNSRRSLSYEDLKSAADIVADPHISRVVVIFPGVERDDSHHLRPPPKPTGFERSRTSVSSSLVSHR